LSVYVRFWGTRGSISKAGPTTVRYGGHTSCVELRTSAGTVVVLDCGTGAFDLGRALVKAKPEALRGYLLLTHTHWDHIQGMPFFQPLLIGGNEWDIYAPRGVGQSLRETLAGQMQYAYFPVALGQLGATIRYHDLVEGTFEIGDVRVTTRYLNHTVLTLGYRLEADGAVVVYSTDHEPHSRQLATGLGQVAGEDRKHAQFVAGADLLIHDSQYLAKEYPAKVNWGHSTIEYVCEIARAAGVRRLALFHHDPLRDDAAVDGIVELARGRLAEAGSTPEVSGAAEGQVIQVDRSPFPGPAAPRDEAAVVQSAPSAMLQHSVLVAVEDPPTAKALADALRADGLSLFSAADGESALRIARSERISLLLLGRRLPGCDGLEVCRTLRGAHEAYGNEVPVVLVASKEDPNDQRTASAAGVSDWLIKPFSDAYVRTRVRAWLLRTECKWKTAPLPDDEPARLGALHALSLLDTAPEERFDRLTRLAAALFDVPVAVLTLLDADRQWFKSCLGTDLRETPRDVSFCSHAILSDEVMVVPDALLDPRFGESPLVTGPAQVRFYAGVPLSLADGSRVGTFCIVDQRPRELDERAVRLLRDVGALAEQELRATDPR
jgi:DNA-binding response OmpR family regulator/ribonuclease BN (tRNA processing enzyme)